MESVRPSIQRLNCPVTGSTRRAKPNNAAMQIGQAMKNTTSISHLVTDCYAEFRRSGFEMKEANVQNTVASGSGLAGILRSSVGIDLFVRYFRHKLKF